MGKCIRIIRTYRKTSLFFGLLLLAGIVNVLMRFETPIINGTLFCVNAAIISFLIVFWIDSVRERLLPTRARLYIVLAGLVMLGYHLMRIFRYRVSKNDLPVYRFTAYLYFIPRVLIPALLLSTALYLRFEDTKIGRRGVRIVLAVASAFSLFVITNDLHLLVYRPTGDFSDFNMEGGHYKWGFGFFMVFGVMLLMLIISFYLFFRSTKKKKRRPVVLSLIGSIVLWLFVTLFQAFVVDRFKLPKMFNIPEIDIYSFILVFECCIRSRLIPYNEKYDAFFKKMKTPVMITDPDLHVLNVSATPINTPEETLISSRKAPVYLDEDTRLNSTKIRAGYVFWTEDEHELHEEQKRLDAANSLLSEENDLIAVENKLKEQKARLDAQNQVYARIASAIFQKQKRIEELLMNTTPGDSAFAKELGKVCVLNAYCKRKTNLLLLSEESLPKSNRELFLALSETARFLKCCGVEAAAIGEEYSELPLPDIHALYDTFETVIETYFPVAKTMTFSLKPDGIRIAMEAEGTPELPETQLPVKCEESDGILFFTIRRKEGGVAE
ncbi:MAG: hypothetical protein II438_03430 [Clostridiales bacterium]|nr:hypothetical protein [Clostridiales bacterium]